MEDETLKIEPRHGGRRPNSGRKKGGKNPETIEKEKAMAVMRQRIIRASDKLLNSQMNLAEGIQMLYKIEKDKKGNNKKPELITNQQEIEEYLDGDYDGNTEEYYFITTERPDNRALDSLFDRALGKAQQYIDVTTNEESLNNLYSDEQRRKIAERILRSDRPESEGTPN